MQNEKLKTEYLSLVSPSIRYILKILFVKCEPYEDIHGKDIYDFSEEEIYEMFIGFNSSSISTVAGYASLLRSYTDWYCTKELNHVNHYKNLSYNELQNCINLKVIEQKYLSIDALHNVLDSLINPCDKYLVLALFWGICGEDCVELSNVKADDVDRYNCSIKLCTGRTIEVSKELCDIAIQSANTYDYLLSSGKRFDSLRLDESNPSAFKSRANARFQTQDRVKLRIIARLSKLRDDTNCIALTIDRLKNAGILYHMQIAMTNGDISKDDIYESSEMKAIQKKYGIEHQKNFTLKAKYKAYL